MVQSRLLRLGIKIKDDLSLLEDFEELGNRSKSSVSYNLFWEFFSIMKDDSNFIRLKTAL